MERLENNWTWLSLCRRLLGLWGLFLWCVGKYCVGPVRLSIPSCPTLSAGPAWLLPSNYFISIFNTIILLLSHCANTNFLETKNGKVFKFQDLFSKIFYYLTLEQLVVYFNVAESWREGGGGGHNSWGLSLEFLFLIRTFSISQWGHQSRHSAHFTIYPRPSILNTSHISLTSIKEEVCTNNISRRGERRGDDWCRESSSQAQTIVSLGWLSWMMLWLIWNNGGLINQSQPKTKESMDIIEIIEMNNCDNGPEERKEEGNLQLSIFSWCTFCRGITSK